MKMWRTPLLILTSAVLTGVPASGQVSPSRGLEIGLGLEYLALTGNWPIDWHAGAGPVAFVRHRTGSLAASLGAAATLHRQEFLTLDGPFASRWAASSDGTTNVLPRAFLELRYAPPGRPPLIVESIAARIGTLYFTSDVGPWVLHRELQATNTLDLGPTFEISVALGLASVPPGGDGRPRSARTVRITTAVPLELHP